jgi:hypothetical protein
VHHRQSGHCKISIYNKTRSVGVISSRLLCGRGSLEIFYCTCNKEKQPNVTVLHIMKGCPVLLCGKVKGKA